ncbi:MAG: hypothetical protein LBV74_01380 [Tannerella sp.]|jgi:hypothetical protein|nr:hypothetical protein [Tannerella sp.]
MKNSFLLIFISIFICGSFNSCSEEDDDGGYSKLKNQENTIKFKVYSNTPGVPITLSDFYFGRLIIKDHWEGVFRTKDWGTNIEASCEDETVLITGEIYVNGELKLKKEGNRHLRLGLTIKE